MYLYKKCAVFHVLHVPSLVKFYLIIIISVTAQKKNCWLNRDIYLFYSSDIDMMFYTNPFGYVTILMILSLNMATNDGEMLFHFADSNKYNYCINI